MAPAGSPLGSLLAPLARPWTHLGRPDSPWPPLGLRFFTFWQSVVIFHPMTPTITKNGPKMDPKRIPNDANMEPICNKKNY